MAVSRRLRFEVLRRDGHTCRYCGAKAPDVKLTVDHVVPTALGGKDEPSNLVTACQPCNAGKTSISPDSELVADVAADALRWGRAREQALAVWRERRSELNVMLGTFEEAWDNWGYGKDDERRTVPRDDNWAESVEHWLKEGFGIGDLCDLIPKAMHNRPGRRGGPIPMDERWRYYCGVVWRTLDEIQETTKAALTEPVPVDQAALEELEDAIIAAYEAGVVAGRAHERGEPPVEMAWPPTAPPPRRCSECNERDEYGSTGLCLPCWSLEGDAPRGTV